MKKFRFFMLPLLALSMLFAGCNKEDEITPEENTSVNSVGKFTQAELISAIDVYYKAWEELYREYQISVSKQLNDELRLIFLYEVFTGLLRSRDATRENYTQKCNKKEQEEIKRIFNEGKRLQKRVTEKSILRFAAALFFEDADNPYNIDY